MQSKASCGNQLNLPHGTKTKPEMLKKRWAARVRCVSLGEQREDLWWEGVVKEVGFELGVEEWRSYGWRKWWIYGKSWTSMCRKIRVRDGETGTRLSEWSRELIPETRCGEKTDQLFVKMTMKADGKECESFCAMSTYNNVHTACLKHEITVWSWERVNAAWLGMPRKVRETSGNFTLHGEWSLWALC